MLTNLKVSILELLPAKEIPAWSKWCNICRVRKQHEILLSIKYSPLTSLHAVGSGQFLATESDERWLYLQCNSIHHNFSRVVQYCRPESSRIPLLSIGKPEVYWCKVLPSVFLEKFRSCWMRGGKSFRWKSSFSIRGRLPRQHLGHGNQA